MRDREGVVGECLRRRGASAGCRGRDLHGNRVDGESERDRDVGLGHHMDSAIKTWGVAANRVLENKTNALGEVQGQNEILVNDY